MTVFEPDIPSRLSEEYVFQDLGHGKLPAYHSWVETWLSTEPVSQPPDECLKVILDDGPRWLQQHETTSVDGPRLRNIIACFKTASLAKLIPLGRSVPPSSDEWDVLSQNYDPRSTCDCKGLYPVPKQSEMMTLQSHKCKAIQRMVQVGNLANAREREWNNSSFFDAEKLQQAIKELALYNADEKPRPDFCAGPASAARLPECRAPDRRPSRDYDLDDAVYHGLYPTKEQIRLCADAKYFFVGSSAASLVDPGLLCAIADSGNDILIGDYCEAAENETLAILQTIGAAAMAFLKTAVLAGMLSEWHFDNMVAATIQFRILGYHRDHSTSRRPGHVYGSRMTGLTVHRHIDLGLPVGIVAASLATGEKITEAEFMDIMETCALINDLLDFRSDTLRKQRENVVLRGARSSMCSYLDEMIAQCISGACRLIQIRKLNALVIMSLCNWGLMACHHKAYELTRGARLRDGTVCHYSSIGDGKYEQLLQTLEKFGSLGEEGPSITTKRKTLHVRYFKYKVSPETHLAWLADATREILNPANLRRLVDFVHYEWDGQIGDRGYCP